MDMNTENASLDLTPTPHNAAKKGEIAPTVLFPGDPYRAEYIAKTYFTDMRQVSDIRGMKAFTGNFNGKPVSVMGSGMGCTSAGIYSYELYSFYDVEKIIRVGTAGGYQEWINPGDMVFAMTASTDTAWGAQYGLPGTFSPSADFELFYNAVNFAKSKGYGFAAGTIISAENFSQYNAAGPVWKKWAENGVLAQDNETYALYCNAAHLGKKALSIVTNVFCCSTKRSFSTQGYAPLDPMFQTALSLV